ncbi:MAG TPA: aspartyl protease family protein [Puia sp.]|nr:aspartyl protease family protein [Puia sp.]
MNMINQTNLADSKKSARRYFAGLLLFLLCSGPCLFAQTKPPVRPQKSAAPGAAQLLTTIPFSTFTGGVMILKVVLKGYPDTLNFILDTGSGGISLDSLTCIRLKIVPTPSESLIVGIGGVRKLEYVKDQALTIGGIQVDSLNMHVGDYSVLSAVYGDRIDGIMGYSFFSRYIVSINYDSSTVSVYSKGTYKYPRGGFFLKPNIVNIPIESASIRDERGEEERRCRFYFDTGAGLCLLLSTNFIADSAIFEKGKKMFLTQAQGMGGKARMKLTTMKDLRFGPYRFHNIPTHIFEDTYNITSYPYLAGLIGNDLLRRFNVIMNYEKKLFYLTPNSHFRDPLDYSYTGLGLYWEDGRIRVGDVMAGSPAEEAGFLEDDVVLSINNNPSQNLQAYKSMLQNVGQKLKIIVSRPTGVVELNLKVKSIL